MSRLEQVAFPLAGGVLCVFVGAVVLKEAPWQVAFMVVMVAVVGWGLRAPVVVGGVLGAAAWAMVTGFAVVKTGSLVVSGPDDVLRAGLLMGCGLMAGAMKPKSAGERFAGRLSESEHVVSEARHAPHVTSGQSCRPRGLPRPAQSPRGLRPTARSRDVSVHRHSVKEGRSDV